MVDGVQFPLGRPRGCEHFGSTLVWLDFSQGGSAHAWTMDVGLVVHLVSGRTMADTWWYSGRDDAALSMWR